MVADSDIAVPLDYLAWSTRRWSTRAAGDRRNSPVPRAFGRRCLGKLGAQFIDDWSRHRCASRTLAARAASPSAPPCAAARHLDADRRAFKPADRPVADDFWLGELTRWRLRTVLSVVVTTDATEALADLWTHELRWLRTIRSLSPAGLASLSLPLPGRCRCWALSPAGWTVAIAAAGALARSTLAETPAAALRALPGRAFAIGWLRRWAASGFDGGNKSFLQDPHDTTTHHDQDTTTPRFITAWSFWLRSQSISYIQPLFPQTFGPCRAETGRAPCRTSRS
ncbi:hypothetical protein ACTMU2_12435 [Cupriavidus basilensis]